MEDGKSTQHMQTKVSLATLDTGSEGLSPHEAKSRLERFGKNEIEAKAEKTPLKILISQF